MHLAVRCDFDDHGTVSDIAIALGSVAPVIVRATEAEGLLIGGFLDDESIAAAGMLASSRCCADRRPASPCGLPKAPGSCDGAPMSRGDRCW